MKPRNDRGLILFSSLYRYTDACARCLYIKRHSGKSGTHRSDKMNARSRLLSLPRELRDQIITLVLKHRYPSPQTTAEVEDQTRISLRSVDENILGGSAFYLGDASSYIPNAAGLLLASRQIRSETQDALNRLDLAYELEVKFVNERYLAPTWTLIPTQTKHYKRVQVCFQSMGAWQEPMLPSNFLQSNPWMTGCGGPPPYVWLFYNTLMHFLTYGIDAPQATATPGIISVERLELNFIDPEETHLLPPEDDAMSIWRARLEPARRSRRRSRRSRCSQNVERPELLRPEWLARDLAQYIRSLFCMSYHTAAYASKFHGRIGYMVFKINGEVTDEIDVGQLLADLGFNDSFGGVAREHRVEAWISWKEEAQELRRKRGLKTVELEHDWKEEAKTWAAEYYYRRYS
jgi:hypothetical protein